MIFSFLQFELDTDQCRLTRLGEPVRIEKLPFELLVFLIEHRDELVLREEIAKRLWGDGTYIDARNGINTAIRKVRSALGELGNAERGTPSLIENVVKRGYRFNTPAGAREVTPAAAAEAEPEAVPASRGMEPRRRNWPVWAAAGFVAMALLVGAPAVWKSLHTVVISTPLAWKPLTGSIHSFYRLATDGRSVFWTDFSEHGCTPYMVAVEGGEPQAVRTPFANAWVLDASPDHRLLLSVREDCKSLLMTGALWELNLNSGVARQVDQTPMQDASYSADGLELAVARGNDLWVEKLDGSGGRRIAQTNHWVLFPKWSPDGKFLRFFSGTQSSGALWEADTRSGGNAALQELDPTSMGGAWTSDGGQFLYIRDHELLMEATSSWRNLFPRKRQLTAGPVEYAAPTLGYGGNRLFVVGNQKLGLLMRYNMGAHRMEPYLGGVSAEMLDFSRDGRRVVWVSYPERALWIASADGSNRQLLVSPESGMTAGMPRFSPDGATIAFTGLTHASAQTQGSLRLYLIPAKGGAAVLQLPHSHSESQVAPSWSPDGTRLLYRKDLAAQGETILGKHVLAILDLRSGVENTLPGSEQRFNQRWSPDGRQIAATPNDESELDVFDLARSEWRVVTHRVADYPAWSADSKFLYFTSRDAQNTYLCRTRVETGMTETLASLNSTNRVLDDVWGQWSSVAPDGSPLILAEAEVQRLYSVTLSSDLTGR